MKARYIVAAALAAAFDARPELMSADERSAAAAALREMADQLSA
jgi:hypothetical protein